MMEKPSGINDFCHPAWAYCGTEHVAQGDAENAIWVACLSGIIRLPTDVRAKAACDAALAQMYGCYACDWKPFTPAILSEAEQAARP
jgi:hypothetical protein